MSQYMLLIRNQGFPMANQTEEETAAHMAKWGEYMGGLQSQGKLQGGLPFSPEKAAVLSNHGNTVANGYHAEANDVNVGGYLLINADSLEEAIEISKGCPALEGATGTIEVRECMVMPEPA